MVFIANFETYFFQRAVPTRETLFKSVENMFGVERLKSVSTQHLYEPYCISAWRLQQTAVRQLQVAQAYSWVIGFCFSLKIDSRPLYSRTWTTYDVAGGWITGEMSARVSVTSDTVDWTVRRVVVGVTVQLVFQRQTATANHTCPTATVSMSKISCFVVRV